MHKVFSATLETASRAIGEAAARSTAEILSDFAARRILATRAPTMAKTTLFER